MRLSSGHFASQLRLQARAAISSQLPLRARLDRPFRDPAAALLDGSFEDAEVNLKLPKLAEVSFFKLVQT